MVNLNQVELGARAFHFIGIGGIGMSALAYILAKRQFSVSGSDLKATHITQRLRSAGVRIFHRQEAANLDELMAAGQSVQVVCSTAISPQNLEYQAAVAKGYPICHRSDVLAALMAESPRTVAVAGTHGKTTTSSLAGHLLLEGGLDPTIVVGGEVETWGGNAYLVSGDILVAEADESDGTLAKLSPTLGVVTNIELDHTDHYHSLEAAIATFQAFVRQCEVVVACWDCENVRQHIQADITYSLFPDRGADYTITAANYQPWGTTACIWERGVALGELRLPLLGEHNLSNALAVVALGRKLGLEFGDIARAMATFKGAKRRFEFRGESNGIVFIDDYAHHPSEIEVTLKAARQRRNAQRVVAIFQPHRYSRTETFLEEFARAFSEADITLVTEVYSAGEAPGAVDGRQVAAAIAAHQAPVYYHGELSTLSQRLREILRPGDLALFLGAGNLHQVIPEAIALCQQDCQAA